MRGVLSLSPLLAPSKVSVIPLFSSNADLLAYVPRISNLLKALNISHKVRRKKGEEEVVLTLVLFFSDR